MSEQTLTRAAVVTGGSRGIGRAVCTALAKQGVNVVVNYCHGEAAAAETVALCKAAGADAVAVQADVSTAAGCKALFDAAAAAFGRVDILVNNAGITRDNLILRLTKSLARELASRNVTVNAVAPGFIETDMTAALPEAVRAEMAKGIPAGRAGSPEDVANAVAFFTAEQSSYLTGQVLCVDGGMAM